jgi:hypothetical protein
VLPQAVDAFGAVDPILVESAPKADIAVEVYVKGAHKADGHLIGDMDVLKRDVGDLRRSALGTRISVLHAVLYGPSGRRDSGSYLFLMNPVYILMIA